MNNKYWEDLVCELSRHPKECEWLEFKMNKSKAEDIGEYISALSNSALLAGKEKAYMIWGVEDGTHEIVGTSFNPSQAKKGNEDLEHWLLQRLKPQINIAFYKLTIQDKNIVLLEVPSANSQPVSFLNTKYIRIESYKKKLEGYPEKEREIWRLLDKTSFELLPAKKHVSKEEILKLLDYSTYFNLLQFPVPDGHQAILDKLVQDELIRKNDAASYDITNLGAILFANNMNDFPSLSRKSVRVIQYEGKNKLKTIREQVGGIGYAKGFEGLIQYIINLLPDKENFETSIRKTTSMFPKIAIRELVANALIHQDFSETGTGVMIELFEDRLEISNPGIPLINVDRLLDSPPKSRNERLASLMRRIGICEERGSGIDKVVFEVELNQLPAPIFEVSEGSMRAILFSHREFKDLTNEDKVRACYFHATLKYIERDYMTNTSLRGRFGIKKANASMISRVIKDALNKGLISIYDNTAGAKARKYVPRWAQN